MSSQAEDIIRETLLGVANTLGVRIDIPDDTIASLAATLQTEIDRIEAVESEGFEFLNELALAFRRGEKNARPQHTPILEGVRAVLAHLTATGRLIPAGGMALTAEQWAHYQRMAADPRFAELSRDALGVMKWPENPLLPPALFPATKPASSAADFIDIVFDGPPAAVSGRFVEVENPSGAGIKVGEWIERDGGHWALRIRSDEPHLESSDRMIPEAGHILGGLIDYQEGHILTTEEMADVRTLYMRGSTVDPEFHRAKERLRPVLFPATEPAEEERCRKWTVRVAGGIETGIQCVLPDGHECFHDYVPPIHNYVQPAPTEPAEEETKAERRDPDELAKRMALIWEGGWDEFDEKERDYLRCAAEIALAYYASSPVVPAPTETGPWQTDTLRDIVLRGLERIDTIPPNELRWDFPIYAESEGGPKYTTRVGTRWVLSPIYESAVLALVENVRRVLDAEAEAGPLLGSEDTAIIRNVIEQWRDTGKPVLRESTHRVRLLMRFGFLSYIAPADDGDYYLPTLQGERVSCEHCNGTGLGYETAPGEHADCQWCPHITIQAWEQS